MTPTEDFDPEKTLFFRRRRGRIQWFPLLVAGLLVLGSGALIIWAVSHPSKPSAGETASPIAPYVHPVGDPASPPDSSPGTPEANVPLNLDVKDPGNAQVRDEVLRRIDLMPGVSAASKDKLYASVDHARSMGKVLTIPFVKGETTVRPAEIERLRRQLASSEIRPMAEDPTVVFVILGYADPRGSDKVNADISLSRARTILGILRDRCGVQNVMHAVAMGGSTLFSTEQADKNRVAEIWVVLP